MIGAEIGKPTHRVDGRAKVTGAARYAAEYAAENLAYGWVVSSTIARGRITAIDTEEALAVPGVHHVFTHENMPELARDDDSYRDEDSPEEGSPFRPLQSDEIQFSQQPVALVVADGLEVARYAATLVQVEYAAAAHVTDLDSRRTESASLKEAKGKSPEPRGDADKAFADGEIRVEARYAVPAEHHNPMEPFAATAIWEPDGTLTVYDKTQGVQNVRDYLCGVFGLTEDRVTVISAYVGGAFGSGLRPQYHVYLAVLAARELGRPVRVALTRQQMFSIGYRPMTWQRVALAATNQGKLQAVIHEAVNATSRFEDYSEQLVNWAGVLYASPNERCAHQIAPLDLFTPLDMRAPGAAWGMYALECAMDELAVALDMDPVALRLANHTEKDQNEDKPFSSKELRACYAQAGERFGWSRRNRAPGSMQQGHALIGWGMASGIWPAIQQPASAEAIMHGDGRLVVRSATEDIGTGTYTIMTQIAADRLGLPLAQVTFELGNSDFPKAPLEGGSFTASTVGSAVAAACEALKAKLLKHAQKITDSPLVGAKLEEISFAGGRMTHREDASRSVSLTHAVAQCRKGAITAEASAEPGEARKQHATYAHTAVFAEVQEDRDLGAVRVTRVVTAVAAGRIINPLTARSQLLGGIVWGIGAALEEESVLDQRYGRFMNHNLAEYHVAVNADIHDIEVIFVDERDDVVNPLGVKGIGEIGVVGVAAAVANAVHHATGRRVRELPITLDRLL